MGFSKVSKNGLVPIDYNFQKDFIKSDYEPWLITIVSDLSGRFSKNPRFDFDELMSEAWLALVESSQSFNPEYSNSFLGYAKPYIYKRLLEFISINSYTFKVRYYNIKNDQEKLDKVNAQEGKIWTESQVGSYFDEKNNAAEDKNYSHSNSLNSHSSGMATDDLIAHREELSIIREIVNTDLTTNQRRAIIERFRNDATFDEIGKILHVSNESARKTVQKALSKIKYKAKDAGISSN